MDQYVDDVLSGRAIVGKHVRNAVERHAKDLDRDDVSFDRERADMVNSLFVSDAELARYINKGIRELCDKMEEHYGEEYFVATPALLSTTGSTDLLPLPVDFLKLLGLDTINKLRDIKKKVGTGPVESRVKDALGVVIENPDRREFNQLNNAIQRIAGRVLEGGKLAEGDARNYEKFILDPNRLDDEEYNTVLDSIEEQLRGDLSFFDEEMKAAGRSVGAAAPASNRTTAVPDDVAPVPSAKVRVRLPDGRTGLIPRANLQQALARGAVEVTDG
jgi:hypothetical protein